tara:strand:- start:429 stop:614 length:186 start_codon:yes stop_codon:yes gene_type:complete
MIFHIRNLLAAEPVAVVAALQASLALAVLFGVDLSADQLAGIGACAATWLGLVTRRRVTPV